MKGSEFRLLKLVNLSELMKEETTGSEEILDAYSWEKQAYKLNQLLV